MNPAVSNVLIMLFFMQVSKRIPFDDPNVLQGVRILYVVSNLLIFGIYFYTKKVIDKKNDLTTLKYVEQPSALQGQTEAKLVTTTVKEYDHQQVNTALKVCFLFW